RRAAASARRRQHGDRDRAQSRRHQDGGLGGRFGTRRRRWRRPGHRGRHPGTDRGQQGLVHRALPASHPGATRRTQARMSRRVLSAAARAALPLLTRMDPERAHGLGLAGLKLLRPLWPQLRYPAGLAVRCCGLNFAHPLGLAAGFDKNGDYLDALGALGFSHVELGTVTPRPQPGNPKPRMFRIRDRCALINRMGFNNKGVDHLVERVARSRYSGIRGISIGKNFDTPLEHAQDDYLECLRKVYAAADYVAVNISSPNTARLRELQARDGLRNILGPLFDERPALERRHGKRVPILVKVAPDLDAEQIATIASSLRPLQVDGVIATNTTIDHSRVADSAAAKEAGGLSGAP